MVRVLFVHDHRFVSRDDGVYSTVFPYEVWLRYLEHFENVTVFARRADADDHGQLSRSSGSGVSFLFEESIASVRALAGDRRRARRRLRSLVLAHDAVVARLPSEFGLLAATAARKAGRPCLVEVVGCGGEALWHHGGITARAYAPVLFARMRRVVKGAGFVSYVTRDFLQRRYPADPAAVTASISNVEIPAVPESVLERRIRRIREQRRRVVIGIIGALRTRYKGVHTAIESLAALGLHDRTIELRVLGAGDSTPYRELATRCGVAGSVFFDGTLPGGEPVERWLDDLDFYLQPSLSEGLPRALIEAMSRGCPAIGSSVGGIPELLEEECRITAGSVPALAALLKLRLFDTPWLADQAARNYQRAQEYAKPILAGRRSALLGRLAAAAGASNASRIAR